MAETRAHRCLEPGLSVLVGTVDIHGAPSCSRAIALLSRDDLRTATVYLPVATSQQIIQNVATTKRVAVTASLPPTHCTTQIKGTTIEARIARDDERAFVRERLDAFAGTLDPLGIPRRMTLSMNCWPAFAVTFAVEEVFEQTPGPQAGQRIR